MRIIYSLLFVALFLVSCEKDEETQMAIDKFPTMLVFDTIEGVESNVYDKNGKYSGEVDTSNFLFQYYKEYSYVDSLKMIDSQTIIIFISLFEGHLDEYTFDLKISENYISVLPNTDFPFFEVIDTREDDNHRVLIDKEEIEANFTQTLRKVGDSFVLTKYNVMLISSSTGSSLSKGVLKINLEELYKNLETDEKMYISKYNVVYKIK